MICTSCGNQLEFGGRFCDQCGAPLNAQPQGSSLVIGRDPGCDIALDPYDTRVSRRHARVTPLSGGRYSIEDMGSSNGVQVNGRPVQRAEIGAGDQVTFGSFRLDLGLLAGRGAAPPARHAAPPEGGGAWLTIGRDPGCDVVLPEHSAGVSRRHARMRALGGGVYEIEDLGSANGVLVNGSPVGSAHVGPQDHVSLGSTPLDLGQVASRAARSQRTRPSPPRSARPAAHGARPRPVASRPAPTRRAPADRGPDVPPPRQRSYGWLIFLGILVAVVGGGALYMSGEAQRASLVVEQCVQSTVQSNCSKSSNPAAMDELLKATRTASHCESQCKAQCSLGAIINDPFSCESNCRGVDSRHDREFKAQCVSSSELAAYENYKEAERKRKELARKKAEEERKREEAAKARASNRSSRGSSSRSSSSRSSSSRSSSRSSGGIVNGLVGGFVDTVNKDVMGEENVSDSTRNVQIEGAKVILGVGDMDDFMNATMEMAEEGSR